MWRSEAVAPGAPRRRRAEAPRAARTIYSSGPVMVTCHTFTSASSGTTSMPGLLVRRLNSMSCRLGGILIVNTATELSLSVASAVPQVV